MIGDLTVSLFADLHGYCLLKQTKALEGVVFVFKNF